jgi:hypothetical protein
MSFNKRIVNAKKILDNKNSLDKIFTPSIDAYIFEDDFSAKICDLYFDEEFELITKTILEYEAKSLI